MNDLNVVPFDFEGQSVRVVTEGNSLWFNVKDVCAVLEFGNPRQAIESHVDQEDVQKLDTLTEGGIQQVNHVNESGLYALIFGSTKESARRFKRWVTHDVLPSIRKTGSYSAQQRDPVPSLLLIGEAVAKVPAPCCKRHATSFESHETRGTDRPVSPCRELSSGCIGPSKAQRTV